MLIGPRFKPFYAKDRGTDLGVTTLAAATRGRSAAARCGAGSPTTRSSTSSTTAPPIPGRGIPTQRPGDNKWTAGVFARDPDTGEAVWAYQISAARPATTTTAINESVLLDIALAGPRRKVLVRPERNGYVYVIDRTTGEVLSADPFGYINSTRGVDLKTGRPDTRTRRRSRDLGKVVRDICPAAPGAKDWQPSAFSPRTGSSTSRTRTCAWTWRAWRRTTSRARRTSA